MGSRVMSNRLDDLEAEVMRLSKPERAHLLERLLESLDAGQDVEAEWQAEVKRRLAEVEAGTVALIPADEVLARLRNRLP